MSGNVDSLMKVRDSVTGKHVVVTTAMLGGINSVTVDDEVQALPHTVTLADGTPVVIGTDGLRDRTISVRPSIADGDEITLEYRMTATDEWQPWGVYDAATEIEIGRRNIQSVRATRSDGTGTTSKVLLT